MPSVNNILEADQLYLTNLTFFTPVIVTLLGVVMADQDDVDATHLWK